MANYGWSDITHIRVDGLDIQATGVLELEIPGHKGVLEDSHFAGNQWGKKHDTGERMAEGNFSAKMFYDDTATDGSFAAFVSSGGIVDTYLQIGLKGETKGTDVICARVAQQQGKPVPVKGQLTKVETQWEVNGEIHYAKFVSAPAVFGADGHTEASSLDDGASSANGGYAFVDIADVDLDGHSGVSSILRHSSDNVTFATKHTFTTATARSAQMGTLSGTINRYTALQVDFTGAGTSPTANVSLALVRS